MGLNILAVSEFLVKSLCILLAISRDPGNCEEHNKETILHEIKKEISLTVLKSHKTPSITLHTCLQEQKVV